MDIFGLGDGYGLLNNGDGLGHGQRCYLTIWGYGEYSETNGVYFYCFERGCGENGTLSGDGYSETNGSPWFEQGE